MEPGVLSVVIGGEVDAAEVRGSIGKKLPGSLVQTVDSRAAANGAFVDMIAAQTLSATKTDSLLAKKPEVDFLLRLARTTQISKAIEVVGAKKGRPFLLVVAGPSKQVENIRADVLGGTKLQRRPLSKDELEKVEIAALLNVEKA